MVTNSHSSGTVETTGWGYIGGLVGFNDGDVIESYSNSNLQTGNALDVGGLVGDNRGNILKSYATGTVNSNQDHIGGLVGYNEGGIISDSYARGNVEGRGDVGGLVGRCSGDITNSYSTGLADYDAAGGGLVGAKPSGACNNNFWDTDTSGQSSSPCGTGKTTTEMKAQSTFTGWNFGSVWTINAGIDYPQLQ